MTEKKYAFIKNNNVVNTVVFDDPSEELLIQFIEYHKIDNIVESNNKTIIGGTYDGSKFWLPQPYPSWIKNEETNEWEAPTPYPTVEEGSDEIYIWDENTTSWLLLPPSN
jgi:hypothetical protein